MCIDQKLKFLLFLFSSTVVKKEAFGCRTEVRTFDYSKLRPVRTRVRNYVPTPQTLRAEMRPDRLPDVSGIRHFDARLLKHVEIRERNLLPTLEGKVLLAFDPSLSPNPPI